MLPNNILFAIKLHYQAVCYQIVPSDSSFYLAFNFHLNIAVLLHHQKSWILNLVKKPNRAFFSLSLLPIASNGKCSRVILVKPTSFVKKSNSHQKAQYYCVQHIMQFGLVTKVSRPQYLYPI